MILEKTIILPDITIFCSLQSKLNNIHQVNSSHQMKEARSGWATPTQRLFLLFIFSHQWPDRIPDAVYNVD
ncbi:hypothetical protein [Maribellus maritimus]|uniref:hypothetical protein n=1 Tax=Maribellus maritimus TaxID=2870838 RepID=UPI001EEC7F4F|nr:hypothetical protein [Maribellus maritimus]MCG6188450.1 hypothetical protein [Maribellus maritimus]